jgi:hypothetical protein
MGRRAAGIFYRRTKMPKKCKCGGQYYQVWETSSAFAVRCNKCKVKHIQHKRKARKPWV